LHLKSVLIRGVAFRGVAFGGGCLIKRGLLYYTTLYHCCWFLPSSLMSSSI
jgi:hypothetical protein